MVAHQLSATSIDLLHAHFIRGIFILAFSYIIATPTLTVPDLLHFNRRWRLAGHYKHVSISLLRLCQDGNTYSHTRRGTRRRPRCRSSC